MKSLIGKEVYDKKTKEFLGGVLSNIDRRVIVYNKKEKRINKIAKKHIVIKDNIDIDTIIKLEKLIESMPKKGQYFIDRDGNKSLFLGQRNLLMFYKKINTRHIEKFEREFFLISRKIQKINEFSKNKKHINYMAPLLNFEEIQECSNLEKIKIILSRKEEMKEQIYGIFDDYDINIKFLEYGPIIRGIANNLVTKQIKEDIFGMLISVKIMHKYYITFISLNSKLNNYNIKLYEFYIRECNFKPNLSKADNIYSKLFDSTGIALTPKEIIISKREVNRIISENELFKIY